MVPLHVAAKEGRFKTVGLLEAADVNIKDNNGVNTAVSRLATISIIMLFRYLK